MKFRLLVDVGVVEFMKILPRADQRLIHQRFRLIQDFPTGYTDFHEYAAAGYRMEINICDRFAIDHLERQVKVLDITLADRLG